MNTQSITEDKEIEQLKRQIRETPIHIDLVEQTMRRYEETSSSGIKSEIFKKRRRYRSMLTVVSVAIAFTLILGSGFISPVLASSLKQIPGVDTLFRLAGDLGLKTADEKGLVTVPNSSDTHQGLALNVPIAMYDGTRVSIGIERTTSDHKLLNSNIMELIDNVSLAINGHSIQSYAPAGTSNSIGPYIIPGNNANSAIIEFADLRNQGGKPFPDQFELTMTLTVSGIQKPFEIKIPVEKNTTANRVITPSIVRTYENIHLNLKKVEFTPITTNLTTNVQFSETTSENNISLSDIGYDIVDDKGNKLKLISGNGWNPTNGHTIITDTRFEPFVIIPESIIIKPYIYIYTDATKHQMKLNKDGLPQIKYIPELEIRLLTK